MRKVLAGITALLLTQSASAETVMTARDYAVNSDVVLESAVREIKSAPRDTVNVVGDAIKYTADETIDAAKGVAAVFKSNPVDKAETAGMIEVGNAWDSANDIQFRSYKVTGAVGKELLGGADVAAGTTVDVSGFFSGIDFPEHTSAYFRPEFNRLMVRQTLGNILAIEDVLAEQHSAVRELMGKQVEIETKFVEVNQSTLNELGFKWDFDGKGAAGALNVAQDVTLAPQAVFSAGLRNAANAIGSGVASDTLALTRTGNLNWSLVINALEQSDDADVLSAPRVVTRSGNKASISVGETRYVSQGFKVEYTESNLYIQHDVDSALMGVSLEVTPKIRSDKLIDLDLKPKVIDLIGYDSYQPVPEGTTITHTGINTSYAPTGKNLSLAAQLPYFRLREITSQLTVADGSTVGMGGLIYDKTETFKDKVPVLGSIPLIGRLFRSEGEKSVKRNLMIFVTATQVDVNGRKSSDLALNK